MQNIGREQEFSELTIESPTAIQDQAATQQDRSPIEAEREWQHQAEINVIDRLQRTGLLAPPGAIDKVLETVVNNVEVTNNLDIEPEVHCRVLLTGTLESFSIGHTIVLSRGLARRSSGRSQPCDDADAGTRANHRDQALDRSVGLQRHDQRLNGRSAEPLLVHATTRTNVQAASQKAVELLKNSPYKDKLGSAGLFLKQLDAESKSLPRSDQSRISAIACSRTSQLDQLGAGSSSRTSSTRSPLCRSGLA